jgi:undecaprenyl diphosphate synthase
MAETSESSSSVPKHIAIIMDGNGRWAQKQNLPRTTGHKKGLDVAKQIVKTARDAGVDYLSLYAFSTENWKRPKEEVSYLMNLIATHLKEEFNFYKENQIRVQHIGRQDGLPKKVQKELKETIDFCKNFQGLTVVLAINYGSRDEIIRAIKKIENIQSLNEENFHNYLDYPELPDVDLLIRTGGEYRISNMLLWQSAYAEFIFTKTLWPDYTNECFLNDLETFKTRQRRYGAL